MTVNNFSKNHLKIVPLTKRAVMLIVTLSIMAPIISLPQSNATPSARNALKTNATRCLKVAKNYFNIADYENANNYATLGLSYDDKISDLLYISAAAQTKLGTPLGKILPLITSAIDIDKWVDYNFDAARTLYAQLLCDTNNESQALKILSSKPLIYSSDAEYIRAKSSYKQFTKNSIESARDKVNAARKIYPNDDRFPLLFFKYEYMLRTNPALSSVNKSLDNSSNKTRDAIAQYFIEKVQDGSLKDIDTQIYAALFSEGDEKQRMLKTFISSGNSHSLYAVGGLESGVINSQEAWSYYSSLKDATVKQEELFLLLPLLKGAAVKKSVKDFLSSFNGLYLIDSDNDGEYEVTIKYKSGRPETFSYDKNNDGLFEYTGVCNLGDITSITVPVAPAIKNSKQVSSDTFYNNNTDSTSTYCAEISYNKYPRVDGSVYTMPGYKGPTQGVKAVEPLVAKFTIPHDVFVFEPCAVAIEPYIKKTTGVEFYTILPKSHKAITEKTLLGVASFFEVPCIEEVGATAKFTILDSVTQSAEYKKADGTLYSKLLFENGIPKTRLTDMDKDGRFETTKEYGVEGVDVVNPESVAPELLSLTLYGLPSLKNDKIFVKSVALDSNGDTNIDYTEEYLSYGEKVIQWNDDSASGFKLRYHKLPQKKQTDDIVEESQFYSNNKTLVTITSINGNCVKVTDGAKVYKVIKGKSPTFYWVETPGTQTEETYVTEHFNHLGDSPVAEGVCVIIDGNNDTRIITVKVAGILYAHIIGYSQIPADSDENANEDAPKN